MRHAYLVAVATMNPAWVPDNLTLRELLAVNYDMLTIRPWVRGAARWFWRIVSLFSLLTRF